MGFGFNGIKEFKCNRKLSHKSCSSIWTKCHKNIGIG